MTVPKKETKKDTLPHDLIRSGSAFRVRTRELTER